MKRIIEIEKRDLDLIEKTTFVEDTDIMFRQTAEDREKTLMMFRIIDAIKSSTPYNPSGDCISRSDLRKEVVGMMINKADDLEEVEFEINATLAYVCEKIDNAQAIPLPNEQIAWEQGYEAGLAQGKHNKPQVTVFAENADEKAVSDLKAELQNVIEARPKGEWRDASEKNMFGEDVKCFECSNCHKTKVMDIMIYKKLPFCPNCGADMRKGGKQ